MSERAVHVFLISGFLGSGKTTFLNHLLALAPKDQKLMILMNEFGEVGIDGALVEDPELDMIEVSKGSIFCACVKGDFIKALYRIAFVLKPDILVIEATGVANPSDLDSDLKSPIFKQRFDLRQKFCLVDSENFLEQYEIFTAIEKQIASSDLFIINKTDLVPPEAVIGVKDLILSHNSAAKFVETTYANVDVSRLFELPQTGSLPSDESKLMTEEELDELIDEILTDGTAQVTPPDRLMSISCRWTSGSLDDFRFIAGEVPEDVVRGKGFIFQDGRPYLYNHVGHKHEIVPFDGKKPAEHDVNQVVFIRREFRRDDIDSLFSGKGLELLS